MSGSVIGSGSDSIVLNMAEEQALGQDAEFTVNVDGQQIGGVETVTASQSAGQTQPFTFEGNYAPGEHNVTVSFVNNFIYPGLSGDRNVYVDGVTYDGQTVSNSTTPIYQTAWYPPNSTQGDVYGNAVFSVNDSTSVPSNAPSTPSTTPGAVSVGSGSDTLVLNMAEDPYEGDAQFTVSVDGQQIGGTQTTTAVVSQGQSQEFDVHGNFGSGTHTVSIDYTNDAVGGYYPSGTPDLPPSGQWALDTADRNLYVMGMSLDGGSPASGAPWELSSSGTENFTVTSGSNASATEFSSGLFASDGTAATGNNAAVTSSALASASSSSMSFVASPTTTTTSADSTDSTAATSGTTSTTTDTTPTLTAAASTTPTTQDFSPPTTASATATDPGTGGSGSTWSATHSGSTVHAWLHHG